MAQLYRPIITEEMEKTAAIFLSTFITGTHETRVSSIYVTSRKRPQIATHEMVSVWFRRFTKRQRPDKMSSTVKKTTLRKKETPLKRQRYEKKKIPVPKPSASVASKAVNQNYPPTPTLQTCTPKTTTRHSHIYDLEFLFLSQTQLDA